MSCYRSAMGRRLMADNTFDRLIGEEALDKAYAEGRAQ